MSEQIQDIYDALAIWQRDTEQERMTLAAHLHDDLGGLLTAIAMDLGQATLKAPSEERRRSADKLGRASHTLTQAILLNRRLIEDVYPSILQNIGFGAALHALASRQARVLNIPLHSDKLHSFHVANRGVAIALYRTGEAILACAALAKPASISVEASERENLLTMAIRLAGCKELAPKGVDSALKIIQMRMHVHSGDFTLVSEDRTLTFITRVPADNRK